MKSKAKQLNLTFIVLLITCLIGVILTLIVGWYFTFGLSKNLGKARTEALYLNKEAESLSNLEITYHKQEANKNLIFDSLPNNKSISSFLADIEKLAKDNNLTITETKVGQQKAKTKTDSQEFSQTISKDGYYELPIKITFSGSYSSFTKIISQINSLRRVTGIAGLEASKTLGDGSEKTDKVKASLNISIYAKK